MPLDRLSYFVLQTSTTSADGPWQGSITITDTADVTTLFIVPAKGDSVSFNVSDSSWIAVGEYINVQAAGLFLVTGKNGLQISAQYISADYNTHATATVGVGTQIVPGSFSDGAIPNPTIWYKLTGHTTNGITIPYNVVSVTGTVNNTPGSVRWVVMTGAPTNDVVYAVASHPSGDFIAVSQESNPMLVRRLTSAGELVWQFADVYGGLQLPFAVCCDPAGNTYVGGYASGAMFLNPIGGPIAPIPPQFTGGNHAIIFKLNPSGQPVWGQYVLPLTESHPTQINGLAYFEQGGVGYLWCVGDCTGTVNFGGSNKTATQDACPMIFKLRADTGAFTGVGEVYGNPLPGTFSWGTGVTVDANGGPIMVGKTGGNPTAGGVNFGNGTGNIRPQDQDGFVGYVVQFNSSLVAQWVKQIGIDFREDLVNAIDRNRTTGELYIAGLYRGNLNLGNGVTLPTQTGLEFYCDAFLAKLQSNGTAIWARNFAGSFGINDYCKSVHVCNNGDVVCGGNISGAADFGAGSQPGNGNNGFIARYSPSNVLRWVKRIAGGSTNITYALTTDANDNVIAGGSFVANSVNGPCDFGDGVPRMRTTATSGSDSFVASYSA
jgi:hypothetical protein